jgi:hypothetical protein
MSSMAKKKTPSQQPPSEEAPDEGASKRYPSRDKVRYVALPLNLHTVLEQYARDHSDEDDEKSISWAARVLLKKALTTEKRWPPPKDAS